MRRFLDDLAFAEPWLRRAGFEDLPAAHRNFIAIADRGIPLDLLQAFRDDLGKCMPGIADADRALNNFERMLGKVRSPLSLITFLLRKQNSIRVLMQVFSASQYFSELAIAHPEYFDFLWEAGFEPIDKAQLRDQLLYEVRTVASDDDRVMSLLRRHRQLELLRIGYRDICQGEPLDRIVTSISDLADCLVDVALTVAIAKRQAKHGVPRRSDGRPAEIVVLALGKLGGRELNYSSDIDLMIVYDEDGWTDGSKRIENHMYFTGVVQDTVKSLTTITARGQVFRVDLRLRPHGDRAPLCMSLDRTLAYYDQHGRTWERQAMVKVRPIAGSIALGERFVAGMQPFIYRRFLNYVEINEIKSIKRRIEAKTSSTGGETTDLKTGHGGIRDIEFVTQFMQLLHGGAKPEVREANTLRALRRLSALGCINKDEHAALETAYRFLRKAEHRLQFMFDLQTHRIPEDPAALDKVARRLGYMTGAIRPGEQFLADLKSIADRNRGMLNRLMLDLFQDGALFDDTPGEPEADLILDPRPGPERIRQVLQPYGFVDLDAAYRGLMKLAQEEVPFLSSVRCRHFLASVAPRLLAAVREAPDPDLALVNLEKVTASLGAKGVLWESCAVNPSLLKLYVHVCSWSQFLSDILVKNPGMIDELLDTLNMNRLPSLADQKRDLLRLLRGAREVDPILHSFKNTRLLGIGVQDILGKTDVQKTTRLLSELAETIIGAVLSLHWQQLVTDHGTPLLADGKYPARFAVMGLGKFGGNELGYHSDLDIVLVFEGDGKTDQEAMTRKGSIGNLEFFTELAQRLVKTTSRLGPLGRLYQIDFRLRPTGRSGSLVIPLDRFREYYKSGKSALWERLALTRARAVHDINRFGDVVQDAVDKIVGDTQWNVGDAAEVLDMRKRLESSRSSKDIKRGAGGLVDVEFALQVLQLRLGRSSNIPFHPNVWKCLDAVEKAGVWNAQRVAAFRDGYTFLRMVESRIRIVYSMAKDDLPDNPKDLAKLALRLNYEGPDAGERLLRAIDKHAHQIRDEFLASLNESI